MGRASDALKRATDYNKSGYREKARADVDAAINHATAADLGEFRAMITNDIAIAAKDVIAGIYAAKDYREHRESAAQRSGPIR